MAQASPYRIIRAEVAALLASDTFGFDTMDRLGVTRHPDYAHDAIEALLAVSEAPETDAEELKFAADLMILSNCLQEYRFRMERGDKTVEAQLEKLRSRLIAVCARGDVAPEQILLILNQFTSTKIEVGEALQGIMLDVIERMDEEEADPAAVDDALAGLRELLGEAGDNPFMMSSILTETGGAMPPPVQVLMAAALLKDDSAVFAHAGLAFLVHGRPDVRTMALDTLQRLPKTSPLATPVGLRRLLAMRNWLPEADRPVLDQAVKTMRQSGIESASWPVVKDIQAYVTPFDGSGMQGVYIVITKGKTSTVASLIGRLGVGVRDSTVFSDLSKKELKTLIAEVTETTGLVSVSSAYVGEVTRHLLAANSKSGEPVPFALLNFAEVTGMANLTPEAVPVEALVSKLMQTMDKALQTPAAIAEAIDESATWAAEEPSFGSWFIEGEDVTKALSSKVLVTDEAREKVLLAGPLEKRRHEWAEIMAWSALTTKNRTDGKIWEYYAVMANELLGKRALANIPLMQVIASQTIEAFEDMEDMQE